MGKNYTCDESSFAATLESLLNDTVNACDDRVREAVEKSTKKGVKVVKKNAKKVGKHPWSARYVGGFRSRIEHTRLQTTGEIGNKTKPGLVHLLEKGHATLTGRRTNAYPHMAPAFEEMQEEFVERVEEAVGKALAE